SLQQRGILSQEQVQEEIDKLNSKRDTITRLIDKLKDIIAIAKNILRDLVDIVFIRHNSLESFEAFTSYTRKTPEQLREEIRQGIADDNYASLTKNYEEIENGLIEAMDNVESQEQTISYREEQLQQLQDKVTDIVNNIRYLQELQEDPIIPDKPESSTFNDFIHEFFNRFYIDKVKTGEMTVEQALQALEQAGQQNSFEYRQLQSEAVQAQQQVQETLTLQRLRETVGNIRLIQKYFPTLPD